MDAEAAYIQYALLFPETLDLHPVEAGWFVHAKHRAAVQALKTLHQQARGTPEELDAVVGKNYSTSLPSVADIPFGVSAIPGVLREQAQRRVVAETLQGLQSDLTNPTLSIRERLSLAVGKLLDVQEQAEQVHTFKETVKKAFDRIEECYRKRGILGIPTGWTMLDGIIGGWEPDKLYFVSARPGAGKTSFGLQTAVHAAHAGARVYVSSQEMGQTQLGIRLVSQEGRVSSEALRAGKILDADWGPLTHAAGVLQTLPGVIDTRTGVTFDQLRSSVLRCHAQEPIGLVLVDYVQMMRTKAENKVYELEAIAYGLKSLAKELSAPVVCLSQLNRGAEDDEKNPPKLTQMRGSGGLEQAADVVLILWTPDKKTPESVEIRVAKHRDGRTGKFKAQFNREFTVFE